MGAWEILFTTILQAFLARCQSQVSSETPQDYARAHYDSETGRIDPDLVHAAIPAARRAAIRARQKLSPSERRDVPRLSYEDLYHRCEDVIISAIKATDEEVATCLAKAATLGDD